MTRCDWIICRSPFVLVPCLLICLASQLVYGDARIPDIHELVTEADHIVTASVLKLERGGIKANARIRVDEWIKSLLKNPPKEIKVRGTSGKDSPFNELVENRRFLMFVFDEDKLNRPGSVIQIGDKGGLSSFPIHGLAEPLPKTIDDMLGRIRFIMSPAYEEKLLKQLADKDLDDKVRARAATSLGYMKSAKAFPKLQEWAASDDLRNDSTTGAAMWALWRIDSNKATPIFMNVAASSTVAAHVQTACHFLWLKPSKEPKHFERLFAACQRWKARKKDEASHEALASLIRAAGSMSRITPEFKALLLDQIKDGKGNAKHVSMCVAGHLKVKEALPLIRDVLATDLDKNMRMSAKLALVFYNLPRETGRGNEGGPGKGKE